MASPSCSWLETDRPGFRIGDRSGDLLDMAFRVCESKEVLPGDPLAPAGRYEDLDPAVLDQLKAKCQTVYGFVPYERHAPVCDDGTKSLATLLEAVFPKIQATGLVLQTRSGYIRAWAPGPVLRVLDPVWPMVGALVRPNLLWVDDSIPRRLPPVEARDLVAWVNGTLMPDHCTLQMTGEVHVSIDLTEDLRAGLKAAKPLVQKLDLKMDKAVYLRLSNMK